MTEDGRDMSKAVLPATAVIAAIALSFGVWFAVTSYIDEEIEERGQVFISKIGANQALFTVHETEVQRRVGALENRSRATTELLTELRTDIRLVQQSLKRIELIMAGG